MNDYEYHSQLDGAGEDDTPYAWLDEWLCEYVDGTMDPALKIVFEEYVEANPELKAHVEKLRETRELLCNCGLPKQATREAQARVCGKVECEMLRTQAPLAHVMQDRPLAAVGIASSVAVALVVGLFAGALLFSEPGAGTSSPSSAVERVGARLGPVVPGSVPRTDQPLATQPLVQHRAPTHALPGADTARSEPIPALTTASRQP